MDSITSSCGDTGATTWECTYSFIASSTNPVNVFDNELTGDFIFLGGILIFIICCLVIVNFLGRL